ncbi:MAG: DUF3096 domain-containing protein [Gammaproteobacteria bacterium]|nr:DUF3096 domain-containing protein [Gammaproteobacteria bacterium]MCW8972027.1 DUF3096 domain-containing protein [Gammaproteobacteria bacterium]MCW8991932.1 DUF3096 domain-containing protein [Gammaproteobacteria bacterium]
MTIFIDIVPVVSIIAGLLVLLAPKLLRYVVGGYLLLVGIIGLVQ